MVLSKIGPGDSEGRVLLRRAAIAEAKRHGVGAHDARPADAAEKPEAAKTRSKPRNNS